MTKMLHSYNVTILNTAKDLAAGDWVKFSGRIYFASVVEDNPYICLTIYQITKFDPSVK